jgi:hypothetical protein
MNSKATGELLLIKQNNVINLTAIHQFTYQFHHDQGVKTQQIDPLM